MGKLKALGSPLRALPASLGSLQPIERTVDAQRSLYAPWREWYNTTRWRKLRLVIFARDLFTCQ